MEIDPEEQKTLPDFRVTEKMLGIELSILRRSERADASCIGKMPGSGCRCERIYNRAIVDELERKGVQLAFDFRDELDVEWAGHPNWYFRISKFSIPFLKHETVPRTWFLDQMEHVPDDLENFALEAFVFVCGAGRDYCADEGGY